MGFLVKFLGVLVFDITSVKMGSHSIGNILHLCWTLCCGGPLLLGVNSRDEKVGLNLG